MKTAYWSHAASSHPGQNVKFITTAAHSIAERPADLIARATKLADETHGGTASSRLRTTSATIPWAPERFEAWRCQSLVAVAIERVTELIWQDNKIIGLDVDCGRENDLQIAVGKIDKPTMR